MSPGLGGLASIVGPDLAFEVTPGTSLPVGGAVMMTTTDATAMRGSDGSVGEGARWVLPGGGAWVEAEHAGVSFAHLDGAAELPLAYGIVDDVAVIAASPDELIQIIELSQGSGESIGEDPTYAEAASRVPTDDSVFFVNVADIVAVLSEQMGAEAATELEAIEPITIVMMGSSSDLEGTRTRVFIEIP